MRSIKLFFFGILPIAFFAAASCFPGAGIKSELNGGAGGAGWVRNTLEKMTVAEKVGQMVICRSSGGFVSGDSEYFAKLRNLAGALGVGGFCIFGGDVYATAFLNNALQKTAEIPILMASDLERGLGNQIEGSTLFPPAMSIGAADSEDMAYEMGKITALEARAVGIHMTYAPVADVNNNPDNPIINVRSFGEDPERVGRLAAAFVKGCQQNGLVATAKHFPGHGDVRMDSHIVPAGVPVDRERLDRVELRPFREAVKSGVKAVMAAHLVFPALDPTPRLPASLSRKILTGFLRDELGFSGLIVTDAMNMGGVTALFEPEEAAVRAVKAGADLILLSPEPEKVIAALTQAVHRGEIPEQRIDGSVKRILDIKAGLGLHRERLVDPRILDEKVGTRTNLEKAAAMFENSVTLVRNEKNLLPLAEDGKKTAIFSLSSDPGDYFEGEKFITEIKERIHGAYAFYAEATTGQEYLDQACEKAGEAERIIIGLFSRVRGHKGNAGLDPKHTGLIKDLAAREVPVAVISFGSPYFLRLFPCVDAYLCAYRNAPEAQSAAVKALFGEIEIQGRLPVSIPGLYSRGHGLLLHRVPAGE